MRRKFILKYPFPLCPTRIKGKLRPSWKIRRVESNHRPFNLCSGKVRPTTDELSVVSRTGNIFTETRGSLIQQGRDPVSICGCERWRNDWTGRKRWKAAKRTGKLEYIDRDEIKRGYRNVPRKTDILCVEKEGVKRIAVMVYKVDSRHSHKISRGTKIED